MTIDLQTELRANGIDLGGEALATSAGPEILSGQAWADVAAASFTRKYQAHAAGRRLGPTSGIAQLDASMDGECLPVGITVITGGPGSGKTALALQAALKNHGVCPVLYVSAEMGTDVVFHRLVANLTDTHIYKFSGKMEPDDYRKVVAEAQPSLDHILHIKDRKAFVTVEALRATALAHKGAHDTLLIIIDSFHSWAIADLSDEEERELFERLLRELGSLAEELNAAIILIAERNRANAQVAGLSSAAGTRKFEYCAEMVVDLERYDPEDEADDDGAGKARGKPRAQEKPSYAQAIIRNPENRRNVKLWVWKNRHGASDFYIRTVFSGQKMRFEELDGDDLVTAEEELEQRTNTKTVPIFGDSSALTLSRPRSTAKRNGR